MDEKLAKELGIRYNTVIFHKKTMEFLCGKCETKCNSEKKVKCIDFSLTIAREVADTIEENDK